MRRRLRIGSLHCAALTAIAAIAAIAAFAACVGDDPGTTEMRAPPDSGEETAVDASFDRELGNDAADSGEPPACNLTKEFESPTRLADISTDSFDQGLSFTTDQLTAYVGAGAGEGTISVRTRPSTSALFGAKTALAGVPQTQVAFPSISSDGTELIYVQNDGTAFNVFSASLSAGGAQNPTRVINVNDPDANVNEWTPYLLRSGRALYFAQAPTFQGPYRVLRAERPSPGGVFSTPLPPSGLGTLSSELAPVVTDDELTLYFAGSDDGGPIRTYVANRQKPTDPFGAPRALAALNDDGSSTYPVYLSPDGCRLYLMSNRSPSVSYDFWVSAKPR